MMNPVGLDAKFQLMLSSKNKQFSLDVDLHLPGSGITAVFGHSGSGKTTLLRCMAGLEKNNNGKLSVNGVSWQDQNLFIPTHKRKLGYVFQESSLFPHLTALGNLHYALKRASQQNSSDHFDHVISLMGIESLLPQLPGQLSGGEKQRVAIARALLIKPSLLLMDEPLASLDVSRKQEILPYLEKLREEFQIPIVYVTHSVDEVARLANYLVVLEQGSVVGQGGLNDVLSRLDLPINLGNETGVVLDAKVIERDSRWGLIRVNFPGGDLWVRDGAEEINQLIRIRILASDVSLALNTHDDSSILNRLPAEVVDMDHDNDPAMTMLGLKIGDSRLTANITKRSLDHLNISIGSQLWAQIKSVAIVR